MAVLVAILAYVVLYPFIVLGLCVCIVLLFGRPKKPRAQKPRNRSGPAPTPRHKPAPRPAAAPSPGYMPRWDGTRKWQAKEDLANFDKLLNS